MNDCRFGVSPVIYPDLDPGQSIQIVTYCNAFSQTISKHNQHVLEIAEFHSRRLCHTLHFDCYERLAMVPHPKES